MGIRGVRVVRVLWGVEGLGMNKINRVVRCSKGLRRA